MGKQWKQWLTLFFGAPKSLQMVIAAMKWKDTPWKESHDQPRQRVKKQRHYLVNKGPSSQGYGFSGSYVWMWELDCKERWFTSIKSVMPSSHLILCHPLLLLPPIPPSIRVFSNESALHIRWQKYWSFSFSISPSNEHPGLISFRMDWLDLLTVQGLSSSTPQFKSINSSALSLLHSPTLTSIHDHRKDHSLD